MTGAAAVVTTLTGDTRDTGELFVGRAEQVEQLLDLLAPTTGTTKSSSSSGSGPRVVSAVAGMGGIGKTALARHTATLAAKRGWFRGGVLFVDLRGYDLDNDQVQPEQVFGPMLRALGLHGEQIPATVDEQATVYQQELDLLAEQGHRVLVVLDNASAGKQVSSLLPRHPAHRALVTTRDTLTLAGAHQLDLAILATDEALQLLTGILAGRRAGSTRVAQEQEAAVRLVGICGALPLALEIIASILTDEPDMTITSLLAELTAADGPGVHRIRHGERALATVFDLSWGRLRAYEPEAAELLSLLTLNPGPDFHLDAAAALAGQPPACVAPWLRVLRQASLLHHASRRWSMHDVIRLHARDHLDDQHHNSAMRRLLEHYQQTAKAADAHLRALPGAPVPDRFTGRRDALEWFDTEYANLTAAVALTLDTGHHDLTTDLAANLGKYLLWRRHSNDWISISEHALTAAQRTNSLRDIAIAWNNLGIALQQVRRYDDAITAHQTAVGFFRDLGDGHSEGRVLSNLGSALYGVRRLEDAINALQTAVTISQETGDRHAQAQALNNLEVMLREVRRFEDAINAHQTTIAIYRETDERHNEGRALGNLGLTLREVRRFEDAINAHQTTIAIYREIGDRHSEGWALGNLGLTLRDTGRLDEAEDALRKAVAAFRETDDTSTEGIVTEWLDRLRK